MQTVQANDLDPTSAVGYAAFASGDRPPTEAIDAATIVCAVDLPAGGIVTSTLSYIFRDDNGHGHLVDPGWHSEDGLAVIRAAMREYAIETLDSVTVTHLHPDHLGMAERLRQEYDVTLIMGATEWQTYLDAPDDSKRNTRYDEWGVPAARRPMLPPLTGIEDQSPLSPPDRLVSGGEVLDFGRPITVVHTPGHTEGSISLVDASHRLILTGDHVLPHLNPGVGLDYSPDGDPIGDYLDALECVAGFDGYEVLPGHGYRFTHLRRRAARIARHHLRRAREVEAAMDASADGEETVWSLASRLSWTYGWDRLEGYFLNSALQQTEMHRHFVTTSRARRWLDGDGPEWMST